MVSPERQQILQALRDAGRPLPPRSVAEAVHAPPDATRKLLWKMAQKGEVISLQGKYTIADPQEVVPVGTVDAQDDAVDAQGDEGGLPPGYRGIGVYNAKTGKSMPWRNKITDGPYPD